MKLQIQKLFSILFIININSLHSQIVVQGKIQDANGKPIEFVTVQLLKDAKTVQSAVSDTVGHFTIETTVKGDCEIIANLLGYKPQQKKINLKQNSTIDFVLQTDTTILDEVTIRSQKKLVQAKSDRYIVNILGNIDTKGKETSDILKQLPSINLSNQSLNMFGKSSVIVYINDRIVRLQGQSLLSYLNSLPPDIIKNVEIITTPPAQYDAEGNTGIIKIVTDKNILPGWKEYLKTSFIQNSYSSYMLSGFASYTGKKMFFDVSVRNGSYSYLNQSNYFIYFPDKTITTFNPKKWSFLGANAQLNFGFHFNENSKIIANVHIPFYSKETITDIENKTDFYNPNDNQPENTLFSNGETNKDKQLFNSELFFKHNFQNKKSFFTADIAYLNNYTHNNRTFISVMKSNNNQEETENYYTAGSQNYNIITSKLDFTFPINDFNINAGAKLSFVATASDNNFYNVINDNNILVANLSNEYNYSENIQAVYGSFSKKTNDWTFKAGIRSEMTQAKGKSLVTNEEHKNDYVNFFPTIYISHKLNKKNNISISYSDRIERPPYQYLDPFRWYITKYDYAQGNPFLKPSYIKNIELNFLHGNSFSSKIYYTHQNDKIGRYVVLDIENIENQVQMTDNFLNVNTYGLNIYKLIKINKLETVLQGNFTYSDYLSNRKEFANISGYQGKIIMNNTLYISKKINLLCNIEENIPGLYNYRTMENYFNLDIGANYINTKKGFEIRLYAGDIFKTANPEYHYISGGIKQVYKNYYDTRFIRLALVWKLGNWYNKSDRIYEPSNSEEKERL